MVVVTAFIKPFSPLKVQGIRRVGILAAIKELKVILSLIVFSVYNIFLTVLMHVLNSNLSLQTIISKGQKPL